MKFTPRIDLTGRRFGRLTVVAPAEARFRSDGKRRRYFWRCLCDCGTPKTIESSNLTRKVSPSCGCRLREMRYRHGGWNLPEYHIWMGMKMRCLNPKEPGYPYYGGRGITICERWKGSFAAFLADMGERPSSAYSVDRINNDGPYSPENCRWATRSEQMSNRRGVHLLTVRGRSQTVRAWAREVGMSESTLHGRLKLGWSEEEAVFTPSVALRGKFRLK